MPWTFAAAAVSGGLSFLSKRKDRKAAERAMKNPQAQGIDYVKLRKEAIEGGFDPLTALQLGGSSAYTRQYQPVLTREDAGQFFGTLAGAIQQKFDNRVVQDPLALDRDYFGLEREKFDHLKQQGYALSNVGAYGSPFGPQSRADGLPTVKEMSEKYGGIIGAGWGIALGGVDATKGTYNLGTAVKEKVKRDRAEPFQPSWGQRILPPPVGPIAPST